MMSRRLWLSQACSRSMTQPHYPQMPFSVSECLPLRSPFLIRLYVILISVVRQVVHPSSAGGNRPQSHADDTLEGVPALLRRPTRPNDARVHRAGAPGPNLDGSSDRDSHVGLPACEPARLATIHQAGKRPSWCRTRGRGALTPNWCCNCVIVCARKPVLEREGRKPASVNAWAIAVAAQPSSVNAWTSWQICG